MPIVDNTIPPDLTKPDRGAGDYPAYGYLWHLGAIGVLSLDPGKNGDYAVKDAVWFDDRLRREPARVALIDTGLADHPNLDGALIRELAIDFGSHEGGAVYLSPSDDGWDEFLARHGATDDPGRRGVTEPRGRLKGLATEAEIRSLVTSPGADLPEGRRADLVERIARRTARGVVLRDLSAQDQRYPTHGTASAGLIVGTPLFAEEKGPGDAEFAAGTVPYFGVDPWSELIPIATSFEPEPMQLTLALLYACVNGADVIHMPRGTDNPAHAPRPDPRRSPPLTRYADAKAEWELFEAVLLAVSRRIPVVCAAGNSGDDRLGYPAALAAANSGDNGIIAVGAVTALGRRAGYANYGPGLTLVAPSNDSRVYTRHQMRIDWRDRTARSHNWAIHKRLDGGYVEYSHQAPLTIDVPGPRGYRGGVATRRQDFAHADFTLFGGTSAASAIVAGVAALMVRALPKANDKAEAAASRGVSIKRALAATATMSIDGRPLKPDISNRSDLALTKDALAQSLFGAGLVNGPRAIEKIRSQR